MQEGGRKEPNWISNLIFLDDKELVKDEQLISVDDDSSLAHDKAEVIKDQIRASQTLVQRNQPNGNTRLHWTIFNLQ